MYGFGVGGGHWGGAVSDQLAVPFAEAMLVPLPEGIDPAAAASVADNVSDGYRHVGPHLPETLRRDPGADVLIVASLQRRSPAGASLARSGLRSRCARRSSQIGPRYWSPRRPQGSWRGSASPTRTSTPSALVTASGWRTS